MIPGFVISIATFPGVIVHEMAHQIFCRLARVAIFDVCYFRFGSPAGYVIHEHPRTLGQNILIAIGPFLINSIVGPLIAFPAMFPLRFGGGDLSDYLLAWLGVSIAMHAFPSTGDAQSLWQSVTGERSSCLGRIVVFPIVAVIYLGALGSVFWLDLIYGVAISLLLPELIISLAA